MRHGTIWLVVALAAIAASVAGATPPSNFAGVLTSRGVLSTETFKVTIPETVTVTEKYKVKVRVKGKLVTRTRTRQVQKTVDSPVNTCATSTPCDAATQTNTVQPGGFSGWHHHPGLVLVVVKSGSVTRYAPDCTKQTYNAGQGFAELGAGHPGTEHTTFVKNEGTTVAELFVAYIAPSGAALRAEDNAPATCNP
ncbi:MAG: hypothetical protein M3R37_12535 [Actinomycetota bacterium]|nr:hypothetical protein [Actinomycetota bacterium]